MKPAAPPAALAPPDDPVRAAAADLQVDALLMAHAVARFGVLMPDRHPTERLEMAREAVQEAFTRGLARPTAFDPSNGTSPIGWLHGILNNVISEQSRKLRKWPSQPPENVDPWDQMPERLDPESDTDSLTTLLGQLTGDERQLVDLIRCEELGHKQIGERLGIRVGTVRTRVSRVLNKLRKLAAEHGEGGR